MDQRRRPLSSVARVCHNRQMIPRDAATYRPVVYETEDEWQREKRRYVYAVNRHLDEHSTGPSDAVTEMMNLMARVADQNPARQWQHPSDLTSRNYIHRFERGSQKMDLEEWQRSNNLNHQRFAKVPYIFERSPYYKPESSDAAGSGR